MRSPAEIRFRLRQEALNLRYLFAPPRLAQTVNMATGLLPDPAPIARALAGTPYAAELESLADEIVQHRFPLLGETLETGPEIRWNRDYRHAKEYPSTWFRRIPYLDFHQVGDHKLIWELNRHQHLVLLAQAWRILGNPEYLEEIQTELDHWITANPYGRGMQWTSALEVAFRLLSWLWIWHLAAHALPEVTRNRWQNSIYQHGVHIAANLSVYFSPNTHLLGEAVALHALGRLFPDMPGAAGWRKQGAEITTAQLAFQVRPDGSHFEQSAYYHVYALDFFLFHALLEPPTETYRACLRRMASFLQTLLGPAARIPLLGDDDGGRLFHPYGECTEFGRASLAATGLYLQTDSWPIQPADLPCSPVWWLGAEVLTQKPVPGHPRATSSWYANAGIQSWERDGTQVLMDLQGFGAAGAGHSHAAALQILCRHHDQEILTDPGTYTYIADPVWRDRFRGTAAHNTVQLGGLDQATPAGPFRWRDKPVLTINSRTETSLDATCSYRGQQHRRQVSWRGGNIIHGHDEIAGGEPGETFWHPGLPVEQVNETTFRLGTEHWLLLPKGATIEPGFRSRLHGQREAAPVIRGPVGRWAIVIGKPHPPPDWPRE